MHVGKWGLVCEVYRASRTSYIDNSTSPESIVKYLQAILWVCFSNHFKENAQ
jgi:hypothetical protein